MTRPLTLTALALALALPGAAATAQTLDMTDLSDDQRDAFRAEVRAYLLENPEVIMEAVNALEAQQAEAQATADQNLVSENANAIFEDGYSWVGGNPDGDITVVEFMDYRCGYCRRAAEEVDALVAQDGDIRFVLKEFPILGEASLAASRFAIATRIVAGDDAYKAVHDALLALSADPSEPVLRRLAEEQGLDADAILAEMGSETVTQEINANRELANALQINGTPTFVMGDELVRGYVPLDDMKGIVADLRSDG